MKNESHPLPEKTHMKTEELEAAVKKAVRLLPADDAREAFEYATNTDATGIPMKDIRARVVLGVLDCEVSVEGVDVYADQWQTPSPV